MPTRDLFEAVTAITHPLPERAEFAEQNPHLDETDVTMIYSERAEEALLLRREIVDGLREQAEHDDDFDPLLAEIAHWHGRMLEAERRMRLLIAYGREFVRPQPYPLKDIAAVSGLSLSGVRIAYDEDEIREVAALTGDKPRRPLPEPDES